MNIGLILLALLAFGTDFSYPDSAAGRCASAYVKSFNSGDEAQIREFEQAHRAASSLKMRTMEDRLTQSRELRARWGELRPVRIESSTENSLTVIMDALAARERYRFGFEFESAAPKKLVAIRIEGPLEPGEDAAAAAPSLSEEEIGGTIAKLIKLLEENYVFPDKVPAMAAALRDRAGRGEYDKLKNADALARQLTDDLRSVVNDKHLGIRARPAGQPATVRIPRDEAKSNYGFERVEVLPGNIGLLKLNGFSQQSEAQAVAASAMSFLANCDALIFDLRDNGGGSPVMIRFLQSYLFDKPTHLNSFYDRKGDKVDESWTTESVSGRRFAPETPVFVLISSYTFSGAEEFCYNLQTRKRALIVGETSGGGAHPVGGHALQNGLVAMIPFMRAENPITKTNWEGVGIKPDIDCSRDAALDRALEAARKQLSSNPGAKSK